MLAPHARGIGLEPLVCLHRILGACPARWPYFKPTRWSSWDWVGPPRSFPTQETTPVHRVDWNPLIPRNALVVCRANCTVAAKGASSKRFTTSNVCLLQHMETNLSYKSRSILILGGWYSDIPVLGDAAHCSQDIAGRVAGGVLASWRKGFFKDQRWLTAPVPKPFGCSHQFFWTCSWVFLEWILFGILGFFKDALSLFGWAFVVHISEITWSCQCLKRGFHWRSCRSLDWQARPNVKYATVQYGPLPSSPSCLLVVWRR